MAERNFFGFVGMNNVRERGEHQIDDRSRATPRVVLNADVMEDGKIKPRAGYQKIVSLQNCHSIWKGSVTLFVADGSNGRPALQLFQEGGVSEICEVDGPTGATMYYAEAENRIYLSNGYWKKVYDQNGVSEWGMPIPPMPVAVPCEGELPPGRYSICYTYLEGNRLSGNSPLLNFSWDGGESGIKLLNLPDNCLCWLTQPDGDTPYLVMPIDGEITEPYYAQPLPSLGVTVVPKLTHLAVAHGRLFGAQGTRLRYSEPFRYEWFKEANSEPFTQDLVMVAPFVGGVYVNSLASTWVMEGTNPSEWKISRIGDGAVPGTLSYALVEGGGYEISRVLSQLPSPVWMGRRGVVVGTNSGHLVHLTEGKLKINHRTQGASLYRTINGLPQIIVSLRGAQDEKVADADLQEIFEAGKLH